MHQRTRSLWFGNTEPNRSPRPRALTGAVRGRRLGWRLPEERSRAWPQAGCEGIAGWRGHGGHGGWGVRLQGKGGAASAAGSMAPSKPLRKEAPWARLRCSPRDVALAWGGAQPRGGPSPVAGPGTARERPASPAPRPVPSSLFSCLSYFFFFFCLGILSTPAKEKKKKLITEQSRVLCWQIAQGALSALIRLSWGAAARCSPRPQPAPDPRAGKDESLRAPCSGREGWG